MAEFGRQGTTRARFDRTTQNYNVYRRPKRSTNVLRDSGLYLSVAAILQSLAACGALGGNAVKKQLVAILIAGSFFSFQARAQERAGSAALGAVSGAVVLGPVGAVAGALI